MSRYALLEALEVMEHLNGPVADDITLLGFLGPLRLPRPDLVVLPVARHMEPYLLLRHRSAH